MQKNDIINLEISDIAIDGNGIGRHNNFVIFVPHCAVGDYLEVKILKVQKNYSFGKIERILTPSPDRINIDCEVYPKCGGCSFRHINYTSELKIKENHVKECIRKIAHINGVKINQIIGSSHILEYRNKIQIPVKKDSSSNVIAGFYRLHSHEIVPINECKLNPHIFNEIVNDIKVWVKHYNIEPYNETTQTGILRHIYIRQAEKNKELSVCLIINSEYLNHQDNLITLLTGKYKKIVSIVININTKKTNVVLGDKSKIIFGKSSISDELCGIKLNISHNSFYQVNHKQTEILYETVKNILNLKGNETIIDLYCGMGAIGLYLSSFVANIIGVDIVEESINSAKCNAKINNIKNSQFIYGDSSSSFKNIINDGIKPDIVIIDPPRKGCNKELIYNIIKIRPQKVVYISCNPSTLARDLKLFCQNEFAPIIITPIDLFPRTAHVETVVLLSNLHFNINIKDNYISN